VEPENNAAHAVDALTASTILDILECCLHARGAEWIFLRELRIGLGHQGHAMQRLDAFALNCLPHLASKRICYELKTSRSDFLAELKRPLKRRIGMRYSNEFFFVTPDKLLDMREVPVECGLIEVGFAANEEAKGRLRHRPVPFFFDVERSGYCAITVPAPWRDTPGPTWQFAAAMLRNQQRQLQEKPPPAPRQQKFELA
jgi:hypothetical protein